MTADLAQWTTVDALQKALFEERYVAERPLAVAVYTALKLEKPLLVEGPAGVGKTEIAKVLAQALDAPLIRLQCYEGLDAASALYEWNYQKQLLRIKAGEDAGADPEATESTIFSEEYLLERPLLEAIRQPGGSPVLLIDELDRADLEFEAFLLEVLSDFQVTIPELGTIEAAHRPHVVISSNRTRDVSDALRRRCLYTWIDHPTFEKELAIVQARLPGIDEALSEEICRFVQKMRSLNLDKLPGTGETLDWARALMMMHSDLDRQAVEETIGLLVKTDRDTERVHETLEAGGLPV